MCSSDTSALHKRVLYSAWSAQVAVLNQILQNQHMHKQTPAAYPSPHPHRSKSKSCLGAPAPLPTYLMGLECELGSTSV